MTNPITRWYPPIYLILNSLALMITGLVSITANAEFQSTARTVLIGAIFALCVLMLISGLWLSKNEKQSQKITQRLGNLPGLNLLTGLLFAAAWLLVWLPPEKSGSLYYYFIGIQPLLGWAAFANGLAFVLGLSLHPNFSIENGLAYWRNRKSALWISLVALFVFALVAALISWLRIWASNEPYWWGAGIPLLLWQVYAVLLAGILLWKIRVNWPRHTDSLLFFAIWGISAWLWAAQPLQVSFFFTPPMFPNHELYPFADLEFFDRASQYALIGQGINNGKFYDRAIYVAFLVYLHTFFGQDYELLMKIQAGLFAVLPAVVYLIGVNLHSRPAGLIVAALASWRGVNALAGMALLNTSTAKHMMTDFPTGLGLVIFSLFLVQWLRDPQGQWHKAAWAAGTLGLTSLLRPHVMLVLIVFLIAVPLVCRLHWRKGFAAAGLSLLAFFASIAPWIFFSGSNVSIFSLYTTRIRGVIEQRYLEPQLPEIPGLPAKPGLLAMIKEQEMPFDVPFQVSQFLNNLQTSAQTLPLSPQLISLRETVKGGENVWQNNWQGDLSLQAIIMLWLGLGITALGVGAATNKSRLAGLALPMVLVVYAAANALARTSGGRYIVPIDWIVILFFGLGLAVLLEAGQAFFKQQASSGELERPTNGNGRFSDWWVKAFLAAACFSLIGGLIPLSQTLHPLRYQPASQEELLSRLSAHGLQTSEIGSFLQENEEAVILQGAALYPRFLWQGDGIPSWPPYSKVNYPRTIFVVIGPQSQHGTIVLAGPTPEKFPHNSDVILLACKRDYEYDNIFDALLVVLTQEGLVYRTQPERPLECPIAEPICNNNKFCR